MYILSLVFDLKHSDQSYSKYKKRIWKLIENYAMILLKAENYGRPLILYMVDLKSCHHIITIIVSTAFSPVSGPLWRSPSPASFWFSRLVKYKEYMKYEIQTVIPQIFLVNVLNFLVSEVL